MTRSYIMIRLFMPLVLVSLAILRDIYFLGLIRQPLYFGIEPRDVRVDGLE